ncbi:MAG: V-type ATP synthase subunit E [Clostridia bacterium]|nr:V-type ATP synthase subunit E [Clostridia bacterium]
MTGLDRIKAKIIFEAEADADRIIERAREKCAEIMFKASGEADLIKASLDERAQREAESIVSAAKSKAAMQKRNLVLEAKNKAIDRVFDLAYKDILTLDKDKYVLFVAKLLSESLLSELETEQTNIALYGAENITPCEVYELVFNENDRDKYGEAVLKELERIVIGKVSRETLKKVRIADGFADIDSGVILRVGDIEDRCTVSGVLSSLRSKLEGEIADILFREIDKK